ncbi:cytoskeleton-associated protein 5-like isoform X2 [Clavelina lepadiformis]|uniref:cytoskeleton-associated protein 5-like isoform X2 n=1 Tax=Clavelina lepadiformis TaxID=159417 RepID=UPI0040422936
MIMEELDMIQHPEESGIVAIIQKQTGSTRIPLKKSDKKENIGMLTGVSLDAKLSSIFKKIGDRQLTKEGLLESNEFKCENPHYDVEPRINSLEVFPRLRQEGVEENRGGETVERLDQRSENPISLSMGKQY